MKPEREVPDGSDQKDRAVKEATENGQKKQWRLKPEKKQVQGFVAGLLVAVILFIGVTTAINPGFLVGVFTKQVGNTTRGQEVGLQAVACEPASVKAQTDYDQTFVLDVTKDKIASVDTTHIQLGGLFEGMSVSDASLTEDGKLSVSVKGKVQTPHAYGADRENPTAAIYLMPDMLRDPNYSRWTATPLQEGPPRRISTLPAVLRGWRSAK